MPRIVTTPQELRGPAQTAGLVLALVAADLSNKQSLVLTNRDILFAYNSGVTGRTVTIDGRTDPYGAIRSLSAKALAAGAVKMFGPFEPLAWAQNTTRDLQFEANHADVKFGALRLPTLPNDSGGVLDAGAVTVVGGVRTIYTPQRVAGTLATDGVTLLFTAAGPSDKEKVVVTGREFVIAFNTDSGAHNVTMTSVADDHGRLGTITESVAAGAFAIYGPFDYAWTQTDRYLYFEGVDATVKFAVVRY